ncbi:MAG: hypothetical protein KDB80_01805, partial [Planctomycetes bacterium]|nr:hypothetical protein [Planctomycetota bacterium]
MASVFRTDPQLDLLEPRIAFDVTISINAGITVLVDTNGDLIPDQALQVLDGSIDLVVADSAVWNPISFLLSLTGGLADLNNLLITGSGTGGADINASFTDLSCLEIGLGETIESANFGVTVGLFGPSTGGTIESVCGSGTLGDLTTTGDLNSIDVGSLTGTIQIDALSQRGTDTDVSLTITEGGTTWSFGAENGTSLGLTYDSTTDALVVFDNDTASNDLTVVDSGGLVDSLEIDAGVTSSIGDVSVTGDLDGFTAADGDYGTVRVTAADGPLVIDDRSNSVTVDPSAATDLSYTGSSDTLVVHEFVDGGDLTIGDASGLIDSLSVDSQVGRALDTIHVTGDLDAFTSAASDFTTLEVTSLTGPLSLGDGVDTATIAISGTAQITFASAGEVLGITDFIDGSTVSITDAAGLVSALSVAPQIGKSLGAVQVTGDLDAFVGAIDDYATLRVTALDGPLTISDGVGTVTLDASSAVDVTYDVALQSLVLSDYVDGASITITDASGMLDSVIVSSQVGKALGAIDVAGNLTSFKGADGDFTSLRVQSLVGALTLSDGVNSVVVTASGVTDLTYTGTSDTLAIADFADGATLSIADANDLLDVLTVATQVGKSLGAIDVAGDLTSFTAADVDYASLRVQSLVGALTLSDGVNSVVVTASGLTDLTYTGTSDTLAVADFAD